MSDLRSGSAYSYPSPATNTTLPRTDISLREILDTYRDNNDLLKQILNAKVEEDRRRAEEEKSEQLRLQCRQVELEMLREQKKPNYTGVPPINTSTQFNVKSPSDVHSPYLTIPPPIDAHFSTTPTSATPRLSPPSSATAGHDNNLPYNGHNHSYSTMNQRPSLTLSIPSFPIITASPTAMHNNHSFSTPTSSIQEHPQSATSQTHHQYSHSPTSVNGNNKRTKLSSESEVDHEYVMEALRQKVQRNQENPAKKFMNVLKPRSASMPVPPLNQSSPQHPSHHHHTNRDQHKQQSPHQRQHQSQQAPSPSPVDPVHSPILPQLPPMNVHSPSLNQEQIAKT